MHPQDSYPSDQPFNRSASFQNPTTPIPVTAHHASPTPSYGPQTNTLQATPLKRKIIVGVVLSTEKKKQKLTGSEWEHQDWACLEYLAWGIDQYCMVCVETKSGDVGDAREACCFLSFQWVKLDEHSKNHVFKFNKSCVDGPEGKQFEYLAWEPSEIVSRRQTMRVLFPALATFWFMFPL